MSRRVKKMTPAVLKRMIVQETKKLRNEVLEMGKDDSKKVADATDEVDADEYADSIEQDIDWMKVLKIHENKLIKKLNEVRKAKRRIGQRITGKI